MQQFPNASALVPSWDEGADPTGQEKMAPVRLRRPVIGRERGGKIRSERLQVIYGIAPMMH